MASKRSRAWRRRKQVEQVRARISKSISPTPWFDVNGLDLSQIVKDIHMTYYIADKVFPITPVTFEIAGVFDDGTSGTD